MSVLLWNIQFDDNWRLIPAKVPGRPMHKLKGIWQVVHVRSCLEELCVDDLRHT